MLKNLLLIGASAAALGAITTSAHADNIVTNQWYAASFFSTVPSALIVPAFAPGTNGPVLPSGTANAVNAPGTGGGTMTAIITMPAGGGTLLATDVEESGDRFAFYVNGNPAAAAPAGGTGLIPGGQQAIGNKTSVPTEGVNVEEDISAALSNSDFSSGTFYLPAGLDTITGNFLGVVGDGSMNFIVEACSDVSDCVPVNSPEPATLSVLGLGLAALGLVRRRRT